MTKFPYQVTYIWTKHLLRRNQGNHFGILLVASQTQRQAEVKILCEGFEEFWHIICFSGDSGTAASSFQYMYIAFQPCISWCFGDWYVNDIVTFPKYI